MDTFLSVDGDLGIDSEGKPYLIDNEEELLQKVYILLSAKKEKFIYDRKFGSKINEVDISGENAADEISAMARDTLEVLPYAEVISAEISENTVIITVEINETEYDVILRS